MKKKIEFEMYLVLQSIAMAGIATEGFEPKETAKDAKDAVDAMLELNNAEVETE